MQLEELKLRNKNLEDEKGKHNIELTNLQKDILEKENLSRNAI